MKSSRRRFIRNSVIATTAMGTFPTILRAGYFVNEKIVVRLVGCLGMGIII